MKLENLKASVSSCRARGGGTQGQRKHSVGGRSDTGLFGKGAGLKDKKMIE